MIRLVFRLNSKEQSLLYHHFLKTHCKDPLARLEQRVYVVRKVNLDRPDPVGTVQIVEARKRLNAIYIVIKLSILRSSRAGMVERLSRQSLLSQVLRLLAHDYRLTG